MLFDEPTSSLDPELVGEVLQVILDLSKEGRTMLLVTHEVGFAYHFATRVLFLHDGVIHEEGTPEQVLKNPREERTQAFLARFTRVPLLKAAHDRAQGRADPGGRSAQRHAQDLAERPAGPARTGAGVDLRCGLRPRRRRVGGHSPRAWTPGAGGRAPAAAVRGRAHHRDRHRHGAGGAARGARRDAWRRTGCSMARICG